jgi:ribosomal protein S14
MLNKKKLNNYFLVLLKQKHLQLELKKYLLKSIIQNQKIKPVIRAHAIYKLTKIPNSASIAKQYTTCFETGKNKGIINQYNRSRQMVKQFAYQHKLTSTRVKSW